MLMILSGRWPGRQQSRSAELASLADKGRRCQGQGPPNRPGAGFCGWLVAFWAFDRGLGRRGRPEAGRRRDSAPVHRGGSWRGEPPQPRPGRTGSEQAKAAGRRESD